MDRFKKSDCLCVSKSVISQSVTKKELNARNLVPIFTKLAIMVVSQYMCDHLLLLVEIPNTFGHQTGSGINLYHCSYGKICLTSNISKMVRDTMLDLKKIR